MTDFQFDEPKPDKKGTNLAPAPSKCKTCGGDRFVTVRLRSAETTLWMDEHGFRANPQSFHEEAAACPDCHHVEIEYRRPGGRFRMMDPATVREALRQ